MARTPYTGHRLYELGRIGILKDLTNETTWQPQKGKYLQMLKTKS
jgi:hypothetical protein